MPVGASAFCVNCGRRTELPNAQTPVVLPDPWRTFTVEGRQWAACSKECEKLLRADPERLRKIYEDRMHFFREGNNRKRKDET